MRFDPSSPASVAGATFSTARKGYHQAEVRAALTAVSQELNRLNERVRQLEGELALAQRNSVSAAELDEATLTQKVGEETARVLQTARQAAAEIRARAEENAARIVAEASDEVARMRQEVDAELARKRADAAADAESEVALAKQQGREMVNEARAYRERVLADLEARTSRARQQLEELAHGRERLLQVFERARLVAVDVAAELSKHPGPAELVNLANTTGPVPVMVPVERPIGELARPDDEPIEPAEAESEVADPEPPADAAPQASTAAPETEPAEAADPEPAGAATTTPDAEAGATAAGSDDGEPGGAADEPVADVVELPAGAAAEDAATPEPAAADTVDEAPAPGPVEPAEPAGGEPAAGGPEPEASADEGRPAGDNVVQLFGREHTPVSPSSPRADVDDLFARLREAEAAPPVVAVAEPAGADEASAAPVDSPFGRRDEVLVPLIVSAAKKLKRVLADEQNGVLDVLSGKAPVDSLDALVPDASAHAASYTKAIDADLTEAARAGAAEVGGSPGPRALDRASELLATGLVAALRERLSRSVAAGAGDNADITRGVRNVYREWKTQHIDDALDDVFRFAYAGGLAGAIRPGTPVIWAVDPSHPACADCEDNSLATDVVAGAEFPTGHVAAPAHPGCHCLVLPA